MPLTTYDITVVILDSDGDPVEGAVVTARLTKTDTDQADDIFVAKETFREETDENGQAVFSLWPNTRGTAGSQYRFKAYKDGIGQLFNELGTVQEQNDNLNDIISLAAPSPRSAPVRSVNGVTPDSATGNVEVDPDHIDDSGTTNKFLTLTNHAASIHGATSKATPVDADELPLVDSAATYGLKKLTWANLKATLKTYLDTLYQPLSSILTNTTASFTSGLETKLNNIEALADVTDATNVAAAIHGATSKATPVSNDEIALIDSAASNVLKKLLFSNLIATLAASQAQQETASSTSVFVTSGRQHFNPSAAKFWVKAGVTGNILVSYNITSLTDTGTGDIGITIANDFSSADYCAIPGVERTTSNTAVANARNPDIKTGTLAAGSLSLECWDNTATNNALKDPNTWHCAGYGDL